MPRGADPWFDWPIDRRGQRRALITGLGIVSPLGLDPATFWAALAEGRSGVGEISAFDASAFPCRHAAEVREEISIEEGLVPAAAARDRKLRFAVRAAREAWASAGLARGEDAALSIGVGLDVLFLEDLAPVFRRETGTLDREAALAMARRGPAFRAPADLVAAAVRAALGIARPPSLHVSACAAGAEAIGHGLRLIRRGTAEVVLAGAADSMVNPLGVAGFALLEALSPGGRCRPFHRLRDGLVIGEGAAFLVLEEERRARRRGARVLGEVAGFGATMDAHRLTAPDPAGRAAARAIAAAVEDAGIDPGQVGYYNAHATGTPVGDGAEVLALRAALGDDVPVSSTKAATGHWMAAAGAVEAVAALMPLTLGVAPPTLGLDDVDPACAARHLTAPLRADLSYTASASFGFGGQNACLVLGRA